MDDPKSTDPRTAAPQHYSAIGWCSDESIGFLMKQALASLKAEADERMSEHGLTDAQWQPLFSISQSQVGTASDVARRLNCDTGALTRMLDRLEEKGLIARTRSHEDRRVVHLKLTPDGERVVAFVPQVLADVMNRRLRDFDRGEVEQLKNMLRRVVAAA
jgi:DNA-binding MarR family transcriptional regulator